MSETNDADRAFAAAKIEIARVIAAEETELDFNRVQFRALRAIPKQITEVLDLQTVDLNNTAVADIAPLADISRLQNLYLTNTNVADIAPLTGTSQLHRLYLDNTQIKDITPLAGLIGLRTLGLRNTQVSDIAPLAGITGLQSVDLGKTQVADIAPLAEIAGLRRVHLNNTHVADIAPLARIVGMKSLFIDNTEVADMRCIADLSSLVQSEQALLTYGLRFSGTPATEMDPELRRLAAVEDARDRTAETLAYLRSLPPLPEPLPWRAPEKAAPSPLSDPPDVSGVPEVRVSPEGVDVAPGSTTEEDLSDPIKAQLYAQLGGYAEALFQRGNRYPELSHPARALRELTSGPFETANILGIHLQLSALEDIRAEDANRPKAEQMDPDCRLAIGQVLRHGPGITMGHPEVVLMEARNAEFAGKPFPETEAESERRLARTVADAQVPVTEAAKQVAQALATSQTKGRLSQARTVFVTGLVLGAGALVQGGLNQAGADGYQWAVDWISANKDAIWTAAQGWGSAFTSWVRDLLTTVLGPKGPGATLL
ncbi:leucine-rich repeat domain-containing protein [Dinoroseobacter sp. S124A]|uniref:leucine-rich repeat domain-containing protein n=1 Tax=Dinoroseobacter sp. S124A TaxID=3415128 RepID=UPI003C7BDE83